MLTVRYRYEIIIVKGYSDVIKQLKELGVDIAKEDIVFVRDSTSSNVGGRVLKCISSKHALKKAINCLTYRDDVEASIIIPYNGEVLLDE